jgi:hypothetical protein
MKKRINELRQYVQFDFYTVNELYTLQLFDKDICANDIDVSCIWENSHEDFEVLFDQAIKWCKERYEKDLGGGRLKIVSGHRRVLAMKTSLPMLIKEVLLILLRVLYGLQFSLLMIVGTMIFTLGSLGYSTLVGNPLVSIICGPMIIFISLIFIVSGLYDYQTLSMKTKKI